MAIGIRDGEETVILRLVFEMKKRLATMSQLSGNNANLAEFAYPKSRSETAQFIQILGSDSFHVLKLLLLIHSEVEYPAKLCGYTVKLLRTSTFLQKITNELIVLQLEKETSKQTLFRTDSTATAMFSAIVYEFGVNSIKDIIRKTVNLLKKDRKRLTVEMFHSQVESDEPEKVLQCVRQLSKVARIFFELFYQIVWPKEILLLIGHLYKYVQEKFEGMGKTIIGSVLFLRFICPILVSPHEYQLVSASTVKDIGPSLLLFSKLVYNIFNASEFGDKESYMSCLNVIIKKYAKKTDQHLQSLIASAIESTKAVPDKGSRIRMLQEEVNEDVLPVIQLHCNIYSLHIYQSLKNEQLISQATVFREWTQPATRSLIDELDSVHANISLSIYNVNLIESLLSFFVTRADITELFQEAVTIKQQAFERGLLNTILLFVSLQGKSAFEILQIGFHSPELFNNCVNSSNNEIQFPNYHEKVRLLFDSLSLHVNNPGNLKTALMADVKDLCRHLQAVLQRANKIATDSIEAAKRSENLQMITISQTLPENWTNENIIWMLTYWGIPDAVANQLVPKIIPSGESLLATTAQSLKDLGLPIGQRKAIERGVATLSCYQQGDTTGKTLGRTTSDTTLKQQKEMSVMTTSEVTGWLNSIGFGIYSPIFESKGVDGATLTALDVNGLTDLGVERIGHRKALHRAIKRQSSAPSRAGNAAIRDSH